MLLLTPSLRQKAENTNGTDTKGNENQINPANVSELRAMVTNFGISNDEKLE